MHDGEKAATRYLRPLWTKYEQHVSEKRGRHKSKEVTSHREKANMHSVRTFLNQRIAEGNAGFLPEELHTPHSRIQVTVY